MYHPNPFITDSYHTVEVQVTRNDLLTLNVAFAVLQTLVAPIKTDDAHGVEDVLGKLHEASCRYNRLRRPQSLSLTQTNLRTIQWAVTAVEWGWYEVFSPEGASILSAIKEQVVALDKGWQWTHEDTLVSEAEAKADRLLYGGDRQPW